MIEKICISITSSIREAVERMNESGRQITLVVNENKKLLGTFTDGDLRRALIKGANLDSEISAFYNRNPHFSEFMKGRAGAIEKMREFGIDQMPLIDEHGVVRAIEAINPAQYGLKVDNTVIIMAGGLGKRLHPMTKDTPKALISIGERPILEIILERLVSEGFQNFIIAINHFGNIVEDYFGNGERWNIEIDYLREDKRLGTAGALSLLGNRPDKPFIVMNCDILTTTSFHEMLSFHEETQSTITMGVKESVYQIPYGVVEIQEQHLHRFVEKPEHKYYLNTGMYCMSPEVLDIVPSNQYFDIPELIESIKNNNKKVTCYKVKKYWIDIGQHEDLEQARKDYKKHF